MELSPNAYKVFQLKYSKNKTKTWKDTCQRVAKYVASVEKNFGATEEEILAQEEKYFNIIYNLELLPGGRILANSDSGIKSLANCFILDIDDSRKSIYKTLADAAEVFAWGGGCGYNFSKIREEGAEIKTTGGKASGALSFLSLFDQTGEVIQQASRRGAQLCALNIDHPDIEKYINFKSKLNHRNSRLVEEYKKNLNGDYIDYKISILEKTLLDDQLTHFNISVVITDKFMQACENNEDWELISPATGEVIKKVNARKLLYEVANQAWRSGDPGCLFFDSTNKDNMVDYLGKIEATNPCLVGDTLIQTTKGNIKIKDLVGKAVDVYCMGNDGELQISRAINIRKTKSDAKLVKVITTRGELICTPDHKIYVRNTGWVEAKDLRPKDKVAGLIRQMANERYTKVFLNSNKKYMPKEHRFVASYYYDILGKDVHHKDNDVLNNSIDNLEVLEHSQHSKLSNMGHANWNEIDEKGRFKAKENKIQRNAKAITLGEHPVGTNLRVVKVIPLDYTEDVYDMEVPEFHNFIANDLVVHNCGEIPMLPGESCNLASINLFSIYNKKTRELDWEKLQDIVRIGVRFLDDVVEISEAPVDYINYWTKGLRRIGLGVLGWADLLSEMEIAYDSDEAVALASMLSKFITLTAWEESHKLAKERGAFPFYDKDKVNLNAFIKVTSVTKEELDTIREVGFRNVSVTTIPPTGSVSILAGVNSGIEPFFALAYKRNITEGVGNIAVDTIIEINPALFNKLSNIILPEEQVEEVKNHLLKTGSVKGCDIVPEELQAVFPTANEIDWIWHIKHQTAWQSGISNAISKTINCPEDTTVDEVYEMYIMAWKMGSKGLTIYRDNSRTFQILERSKNE